MPSAAAGLAGSGGFESLRGYWHAHLVPQAQNAAIEEAAKLDRIITLRIHSPSRRPNLQIASTTMARFAQVRLCV